MLEKTLESPLDWKEIQPVHSKRNQSWVFIGRTDVEVETPILWPPDVKNWLKRRIRRTWCWERLKAGGEGDNRGWDGWTASPTQWTWVWVNSRSWWWTGRPSVPQSMGSQRVGHDWVTELNIYTSFYQVLGFKITAKNSQWTFWGVVIITRKDGNNMNTQYTQHVIFALLLFRKGY